MWERWIGIKKEMYVSVYPERRLIRLSRGLVANLKASVVDIFIDNDTGAFGFRKGNDVKVRRDGSISKTTFIGWLGVCHKAKIAIKYSKKDDLFIGKIKRSK